MQGLTSIAGDDGVQSLALIDKSFEVLHVFELLVRWDVASYRVFDLLSETGQHGWLAGQLPDEIGKERCCRVATCEENVEKFAADYGAVLGCGEEFVEKDVAV